MVTLLDVVVLPILIWIGTVSLGLTPMGTWTLIWLRPTNWGDRPENWTFAEMPPISTVGVATVFRVAAPGAVPSVMAGVTGPRPFARRTSISPGLAGWVASAIEPSGLMAMAWPVPEL